MPKVKTHSGAKKRFKKTKNGMIKAGKPYHRHLLTKKTSKTKRGMRKGLYICDAMYSHIVHSLPYL